MYTLIKITIQTYTINSRPGSAISLNSMNPCAILQLFKRPYENSYEKVAIHTGTWAVFFLLFFTSAVLNINKLAVFPWAGEQRPIHTLEVRPANPEKANTELQTCECFYSLHRLPEQNGLLCNCEGEKRKEGKNVLALSVPGLDLNGRS